MTGNVFLNTWITRLRAAHVTGRAVTCGVSWIAIVRVDDMAGCTTRGAEVTRMIVAAEEVQCGVKKPCLLQSKKNRISTIVGSKSTRTKSFVRLAWLLFLVGQSNFQTAFSAPFEHSQYIARLGNLPTGNGIQEFEQTFRAAFFKARLGNLD